MSFWQGLSEAGQNAALELAAALRASNIKAPETKQGDAGYVRLNTGALHEMHNMKPQDPSQGHGHGLN